MTRSETLRQGVTQLIVTHNEDSRTDRRIEQSAWKCDKEEDYEDQEIDEEVPAQSIALNQDLI